VLTTDDLLWSGLASGPELADVATARERLRRARDLQSAYVYEVMMRSNERAHIPSAASALRISQAELLIAQHTRELHDAALVIIHRYVTAKRSELSLLPVLPNLPGQWPHLNGSCRTWWESDPDLITPDGSGVTQMCALETGHRGPHVNLRSGDVRLGHEPELAHVPTDHVRDLVTEVTEALDASRPEYVITYQDTFDLWVELYAEPHDHRVCGHCPRDVW